MSRFTMLETLRAFALEQVEISGTADVVQRAHTLYYLTLAESAAKMLTGSQRQMWLCRVEDDYANMRVVFARALDDGDTFTAVRLFNALWQFWLARGHVQEGWIWLTQLLNTWRDGEARARIRAFKEFRDINVSLKEIIPKELT
jgi:predicted ATPase